MKLQIFKKWYSICKPNTKLWFYSFVLVFFTSILSFLQPFASAKMITCITMQNYSLAFLWAVISFCLIAGTSCLGAFEYSIYPRLYHSSFAVLNDKYISSIISAKNPRNNFSSDLYSNVVNEDIDRICDFSDKLCEVCGNIFKLLFVLVFISIHSIWAGVILLLVTVLNYFLMKYYTIKKHKVSRTLFMSKLYLSEKFTDMSNNKAYINKLNVETPMIMEYNYRVDEYGKAFSENVRKNSIKDNWFSLIWNAVITLIIFIIITTISKGQMSLTVFLVIIPYVNSFITKTNSVSEFVQDLSNLENSIDRFVGTTNLKKQTNLPKQTVDLLEIEYNKSKILSAKKGNIYTFKNDAFYNQVLSSVLSNKNKPFGFSYFINGKKQDDLSEFCSAPSSLLQLFDDTIMKNLLIFKNNKRVVINMLKELNIYDELKSLSSGINTNIIRTKEKLNDYTVFCLNLIISILSKSEVIVLHNIPFDKDDYKFLAQFLTKYKNEHIVLVFEKMQHLKLNSNKKKEDNA